MIVCSNQIYYTITIIELEIRDQKSLKKMWYILSDLYKIESSNLPGTRENWHAGGRFYSPGLNI